MGKRRCECERVGGRTARRTGGSRGGGGGGGRLTIHCGLGWEGERKRDESECIATLSVCTAVNANASVQARQLQGPVTTPGVVVLASDIVMAGCCCLVIGYSRHRACLVGGHRSRNVFNCTVHTWPLDGEGERVQ